jgi:predicted protein tyrosine phosphatase
LVAHIIFSMERIHSPNIERRIKSTFNIENMSFMCVHKNQ